MQPSNLIVHCLIDPRRDSTLPAHLVAQGVFSDNIAIHSPVHRPTIVESINASHKAIVAANLDHPYVCVMEQDCHFPANDGLKQWLNNLVPGSYPLYLAGAYNIPQLDRLRQLAQSPFDVFWFNNIEGFHCYILFRVAYASFLALPDDEHIDVAAISTLGAGLIYPMCAVQLAGYSSTASRWTDKNQMLEQRDAYGGLPHP